MKAQIGSSSRMRAAQWSLTLRDEEVDPRQVAAWVEWIHADPTHMAEFEKMESLTGGLDALSGVHKAALLRRYGPAESGLRTGRTRFAVAACALLALAAGAWWYAQQHLPFSATYLTAKGENRELALPDGTAVVLGAGTRIDVSYGMGERVVRLRDGEAYFSVQRQTRRPFVVLAGDLHLTDIGTDFDVRKSGPHITVTVAEGIVDVRRRTTEQTPAASASAAADAAPDAQVYRLNAGEQMRVGPATNAPVLARVDADMAASWRGGRLDFQDETLAVVVSHVNRYAEHELIIVDTDVAHMRFTGTVFYDRIEDWLTATSHLFKLRTEPAADGRIMLFARE